MTMTPFEKASLPLLEAVEQLCKVYVGKNAPSEQWLLTCERFVQLDKLAKKARKAAKTTTALKQLDAEVNHGPE